MTTIRGRYPHVVQLAVGNAKLTPTQFAILKDLLSGKVAKEIAAERNSSVRVVKFHLAAIYKKYGATSFVGLLNQLGSFEVSIKWIPKGD